MKLPKIEDWNHDGLLVKSKDGRVLDNQELAEAYLSMINALIGANAYISKVATSNSVHEGIRNRHLNRIRMALKKAGVRE